MKSSTPLFLGLVGFAVAAFATEPAPAISAASILARVKVLASDEFEGRAPGSPGEEKTVAYLVSEFKKLGLQPGNPDGSYIQHQLKADYIWRNPVVRGLCAQPSDWPWALALTPVDQKP